MSVLRFTKMHGAGNDYIYVDCFRQRVEDPARLAVRLSDRHKGIGSDGLILICPSGRYDGRMEMYNADGSEGKMCGNGIRCVAKYLYDEGYARKDKILIETLSGVKTCETHVKGGKVGTVTVDMGKAVFTPSEIPVNLDEESVIGKLTPIAGGEHRITCVSMGNPHCVIFGGDPDTLQLEPIGPLFEHDPLFPQGVNTEFVQVIDRHTLKMRVWERGSGETMACGTGTCAAAAAACENGLCSAGEDITVKLRGGELTVNYTKERVLMTGEAVRVFEGEIEV